MSAEAIARPSSSLQRKASLKNPTNIDGSQRHPERHVSFGARTDISPALEGLQELLMDIPESPVASGSVTSPRRTLGRDISLKKVIQTAYSSAMHDPALQSTFKQLDAAELARQQQALRHLAFEIDEEEGQAELASLRQALRSCMTPEGWRAFVGHFQSSLDAVDGLPQEAKERVITLLNAA